MPRTKHGGGGVAADFKRRKGKVGRRVATANVTNTSFKWSTLRVANAEQAAAAVTEGHSELDQLKDMLNQTRHHNAANRRDMLHRLATFLVTHPRMLASHTGSIVEACAERLLDADAGVRGALLACWDGVVRRMAWRELAPFAPQFVAFARAALTQLAPGTRLDAVAAAMVLWIHHAPSRPLLRRELCAFVVDLLDPALYPLLLACHVHHVAPPGLALGVHSRASGSGGGPAVVTPVTTVPPTTTSGLHAFHAAKVTSTEARVAVAHAVHQLLSPPTDDGDGAQAVPSDMDDGGVGVHDDRVVQHAHATDTAAAVAAAAAIIGGGSVLGGAPPAEVAVATMAGAATGGGVGSPSPLDLTVGRALLNLLRLWLEVDASLDVEMSAPGLHRGAVLCDAMAALLLSPLHALAPLGTHAHPPRAARWLDLEGGATGGTGSDVSVFAGLRGPDVVHAVKEVERCVMSGDGVGDGTRLRQAIVSSLHRHVLKRFPLSVHGSGGRGAGLRDLDGVSAPASLIDACIHTNAALARMVLATTPARMPHAVAAAVYAAWRAGGGGSDAGEGAEVEAAAAAAATTNPFAVLGQPSRPKPPVRGALTPAAAAATVMRGVDTVAGHKRQRGGVPPTAASESKRVHVEGEFAAWGAIPLEVGKDVAAGLGVHAACTGRLQALVQWLQAQFTALYPAALSGGRPPAATSDAAAVALESHTMVLLRLLGAVQAHSESTYPTLHLLPLLDTVSTITKALPYAHGAQPLFGRQIVAMLHGAMVRHGTAIITTAPLLQDWFARLPKLLWGLPPDSRHVPLLAAMVVVLQRAARHCTPHSAMAVVVRDAVRQLTPVLFTVRTSGDGGGTPLFGPFLRWPAALQRATLAVVQQSGVMTPLLRRAMCAVAMSAATGAPAGANGAAGLVRRLLTTATMTAAHEAALGGVGAGGEGDGAHGVDMAAVMADECAITLLCVATSCMHEASPLAMGRRYIPTTPPSTLPPPPHPETLTLGVACDLLACALQPLSPTQRHDVLLGVVAAWEDAAPVWTASGAAQLVLTILACSVAAVAHATPSGAHALSISLESPLVAAMMPALRVLIPHVCHAWSTNPPAQGGAGAGAATFAACQAQLATMGPTRLHVLMSSTARDQLPILACAALLHLPQAVGMVATALATTNAVGTTPSARASYDLLLTSRWLCTSPLWVPAWEAARVAGGLSVGTALDSLRHILATTTGVDPDVATAHRALSTDVAALQRLTTSPAGTVQGTGGAMDVA